MNSFSVAVCILGAAFFTATEAASCSAPNNTVVEINCSYKKACVNNVIVTTTCSSPDYYDKNTDSCLPGGDGNNECGYTISCAGYADGYYAGEGASCNNYFYCSGGVSIGPWYAPLGTMYTTTEGELFASTSWGVQNCTTTGEPELIPRF